MIACRSLWIAFLGLALTAVEAREATPARSARSMLVLSCDGLGGNKTSSFGARVGRQ